VPSGRAPAEAVERYRAQFVETVRCIAHGSRASSRERRYEVDQEYTIALNRSEPLQLRSSPGRYLSASQRFRVARNEGGSTGPFLAYTIEYWYQFLFDDEVELLAYHWTPEAFALGQKTYPHLHIGAAMVSVAAPVFPDTFHKKHVPSGQVSIESVVRFAIEELGVPPLRRDWSDILDRGQRQFDDDQLE